jgi:hypothetical protein
VSDEVEIQKPFSSLPGRTFRKKRIGDETSRPDFPKSVQWLANALRAGKVKVFARFRLGRIVESRFAARQEKSKPHRPMARTVALW